MTPRDLTAPGGIEDFLLFRMSKVIALGGGIVTRICEGQFGITRREWTVLAILARQESMPWAELARRCEIDNARLSRAVSSLVGKRLARKSHRTSRQVEVSLTDEGRDLYAALFPVAREINAELLRVLDATRLASLDEALSLMHARGEALARETPVPKAGRSKGRRRDAPVRAPSRGGTGGG